MDRLPTLDMRLNLTTKKGVSSYELNNWIDLLDDGSMARSATRNLLGEEVSGVTGS